MKLLILTQKVDVNDDVLGFMHGWIEEFARQAERVTVICLQERAHALPANVKILSLGKETGRSRLKYLMRFYRYVWQERENYECVWVHMNQEYVVLGGILWRLLRKKIGLWYAHGHVPFTLRIAEKLAHVIFTSTRSGCRLESRKIHVIGQGIDVTRFVKGSPESSNVFRIVAVGRLSPVKRYDLLIEAVRTLVKNRVPLAVEIMGGAGTPEQRAYETALKRSASEQGLDGVVRFAGAVPNREVLHHLQQADLFVNSSETGSLDKAAAEAMACEVPVVTANEAFREVLGEYQKLLMYEKGSSRALAEKIYELATMRPEERRELGAALREIIVHNHSLERFVGKVLTLFQQIVIARRP